MFSDLTDSQGGDEESKQKQYMIVFRGLNFLCITEFLFSTNALLKHYFFNRLEIRQVKLPYVKNLSQLSLKMTWKIQLHLINK